MYYGGSANVPGAPGNPQFFSGYNPLMAGSPSFEINPNRQPTQPGAGPQAPNMYMPTRVLDPTRRQQRIDESIPTTAVRLAGLMPGMQSLGNTAFYAGPQLGQQLPTNFQGKSVY